MTHPVTLEKIGRSLNPPISKQAVAKYVASGVLLRGRDGIDVDDPQNRQWLLARGADLTVFYGKEAAAAKTTAPKAVPPSAGTPAVPGTLSAASNAAPDAGQKRKNQHDAPQTMTFFDAKGNPVNISTATMIQRYLALKADTTLKEQKILEVKNALFEKRVVQNVVAGIMSEMVNVAMSVPQAIVDNIMNAIVISPDSAREVIVRLLQDAYLHEYRLIGQTIKKKLSNMRNEKASEHSKEEEKTA